MYYHLLHAGDVIHPVLQERVAWFSSYGDVNYLTRVYVVILMTGVLPQLVHYQ